MADKKAGKGDQHNDWGHSQAGAPGNVQSAEKSNIGGVPGSHHKDWGHSPVPTTGNLQSEQGGGNGQASGAGRLKRQGIMPGEEMGHLRSGQDWKNGARKRGSGRD